MLRLVKLLLPVLIPSWRFFQAIEPSPRIEWLRADGEWVPFRARPARVGLGRMARRLFWNPRWNETLYMVSLSERMAEEPTEHSLREIGARLRADLGVRGPVPFRLVFVHRKGEDIRRDVTFVSNGIV